ncbi:MAG: vWA domain-containing protein [Patescibacteria group bacterium]
MSSWAKKRKLMYVAVVCSVIFLSVLIPFLIIYNDSPTCFDGKRNNNEQGVDCGGNCAILCTPDLIKPIVLWERVFRVLPGVYNTVAYIENPNISAHVRRAQYIFKLYDADNILITEKIGTTFIPPKKTFGIFEGGIDTGERIPTRVTFEFTHDLVWEKDAGDNPEVFVDNALLSKTDTKPRIDARLTNTSLRPVSNVEAVAIIFDTEGVAIGASRTFVDYLEKNEVMNIVFTWPEPFETGLGFCQIPVDAMLVIDRSGSMDDDQINPPEPLTSVKRAAGSFLNRFEDRDQVGLVSFATNASHPADSFLTNDFDNLRKTIDAIFIHTDSVQSTNIKDGMEEAYLELASKRSQKDSSKIIVVLTDGIATHPQSALDKNYPEVSALEVGEKAKKVGIQIFSIGLGNMVNREFLKKLASNPNQYYFAPKRSAVDEIYKEIATSLCRKGATIITIIPRVYPSWAE